MIEYATYILQAVVTLVLYFPQFRENYRQGNNRTEKMFRASSMTKQESITLLKLFDMCCGIVHQVKS